VTAIEEEIEQGIQQIIRLANTEVLVIQTPEHKAKIETAVRGVIEAYANSKVAALTQQHERKIPEYPFTFGRMVVDLKHQFFGRPDPSVFVIADPAADEEAGDEKVWIDHYRGHSRIPFKDLRDTNRYQVLGLVDPSRPVYEQLKQAEAELQQQPKGAVQNVLPPEQQSNGGAGDA
jgi:hypothetical protein